MMRYRLRFELFGILLGYKTSRTHDLCAHRGAIITGTPKRYNRFRYQPHPEGSALAMTVPH